MSAGRVKRIPPLVHVGKAGDKSVDKRDFLCTEPWINCGYLWDFSVLFLKAQVSRVTSSYIAVHESN
jgi:hypothetical protein